ncbi:hypothetical protein BT96DRAFT_822971, partial [Gymnopus androsaceus JB14]
PNFFIFDTNCIVSKYVGKSGSAPPPHIKQFFANIGLLVDVFHFNCKHKETDEYCNQYCNPWAFKHLLYLDENGQEQWYFNTSIAEQTNAWFGCFHPICSEMSSTFYKFFLNQMIILHN